jgi:predicted nucleic acid-binding protein
MEEVASTISERCRRKLLSAAEGNAAYRAFALRRPRLVDSASQVNQALTLSVRHHISIWDSTYLALAIDQKADLITADQRFHRAASRRYPFAKLLGRSLI